jgi:iron complex transport system permease protein
MPRQRTLAMLCAFALLALICVLFSAALGSATSSPGDALRALFDGDHPAHGVVLHLRMPRIAAGFTVGALLAVAGCLLQVLLRNPLAEPYVLGVSGGAAFAAMLALSFLADALFVTVACAMGAGASLCLLLLLTHREFSGRAPQGASERLLLAGVMLAALWGALIALGLSLVPGARLQPLIFWLMGDLGGASNIGVAGLILVAVLALALRDARALNLLARGEEHAFALGVSVGALKLRAVIFAALASGAAVSVAGTVGFVGLLAPHLARLALGNDQRVLLPASALFGGAFVVFCDTLARIVIAPQQLPVGAVTALLGAPLFLFLLRRVAGWSSN